MSKVCSQIVFEMLVLGKNWKTWYFMVSEQTCKISHEMDTSMWQTTSKVDFLSSLHEWQSSVLSCGIHGTAFHNGFVPRLRLCWRLWGLKINLRRCLVYFWKQNMCPSELDVQEANVSVTHFYRVWNYCSGRWTTYGWVTCSRSLGHCDWSSTYKLKATINPFWVAPGSWKQVNPILLVPVHWQHFNPTEQFAIPKPWPRMSKQAEGWPIGWGGTRAHQHTFFLRWISVVHFWR